MSCDENGCNKPDTFVVVTERPSNHAEIVSVLAFCDDHKEGPVHTLADLLDEWQDYSLVDREDLEEYIESYTARQRMHLWLTI